MKSRFPGWVGLLTAAAFVASACTSAATPAPTPVPTSAPTGAATAGPTDTPAPTELPGTKSFSVGFTNAGISSAPMIAALDRLNQQGWNIEIPIIESSELVVQGVASGQFAGGSGANNAAMSAIDQGANLKLVISRIANEWAVYAANDIKTCADLSGRKLAIHSEGAVSTAMVKNWLAEKCPDAKPNYLIIPGSENRLAALLANQIDASPVELGDGVTLDLQAADRYHLLTSFAQDLPNLQPTSVYFNAEFMAANPGSVLAVIKSMLTVYREIEGHPELLAEVSRKFVPNAITEATLTQATQKYTDWKIFPTDGGITPENLQYTIDFFGPNGTGSVPTVLKPEQVADLTFLQTALKELGS